MGLIRLLMWEIRTIRNKTRTRGKWEIFVTIKRILEKSRNVCEPVSIIKIFGLSQEFSIHMASCLYSTVQLIVSGASLASVE